MTISNALNSAMTGLAAVGRATELVSENIANAMTPGYGVRTLSVSSNAVIGHGVSINGVQRRSDPVLIANRRAAEAEFEATYARTEFFDRLDVLVGGPDDLQSVSASLADFESSLITAASMPDSVERLNDVAIQATLLTTSLNRASDGLQDLRSQADRSIGTLVEQLNSSLEQVQSLNDRITASQSSGGDVSGLLDQRQLVIDDINRIVPVTVAPRDNGQVALYSDGGAILLDGQAAHLEFTSANTTMPHMTVENGALSGLTLNGVPIRTGSENGALRGGLLGAQFEIRDELAVEAQASLDAVAQDLIERFEDPGLDPTLAVGDPGLFTDYGAALSPPPDNGLAGRISINAAVDPAQGGDSWKLRDGLGAIAPGASGDATLLQGYSDALAASRPVSSDAFGSGSMSATDLSASLTSQIGLDLYASQSALGFASSSYTELSRIELSQGVDTDSELQSLLVLEQAYAANAKVIQAVDEMMDSLLRI